MFIGFRYHKLRAALAMEKTKAINQNKQQKIHLVIPLRQLKVPRPKTLCLSFLTETKYKQITTLKLLLIHTFFARKDIRRKNKRNNRPPRKKHLRGKPGSVSGRGGGEGGGLCSRSMSGGKPVFVSVMYLPKAHTRRGLDHILASSPREETSFSRRSQTLARAGQDWMACWKESGQVPHRGQVRSGFSSNHAVWVAR